MAKISQSEQHLFRAHPNGGGFVCHLSEVSEDSYVSELTVVRNSRILEGAHVEGDIEIKNSSVCKSKVVGKSERETSTMLDSRITGTEIRGFFDITNCFSTNCEMEGRVMLKSLWLITLYLKGKITLIGIPKDDSLKIPDFGFPKVMWSHIEANITIEIPFGMKFDSIDLKPEDSLLKVFPSRDLLLKRLETSISLYPSEPTEVVEEHCQ
jgi:hypothetical protein